MIRDVDYISQSFLEAFEYIGREVYYVPLLSDSRNGFGEFTFNYAEDNKVKLNVIFVREATVDKDLAEFWTGRINANCTFINKQLQEKGIVLKERDAIDVITNGVVERFIITGYKQDPLLIDVFTKVTVTDVNHAFNSKKT